jgi:hypothetical protein
MLHFLPWLETVDHVSQIVVPASTGVHTAQEGTELEQRQAI